MKFSNCSFIKVSFGQTKIENCEFRSCIWEDIGISPNGLELSSTYLSNVSDFIAAAATNLDPVVLQANKADGQSQKLRLENTKATIARRFLKMLQDEGDEDAFYNCVRTFQLQHATSQMASARLRLRDRSLGLWTRSGAALAWVTWLGERELLRSIGCINGWGSSVIRPMLWIFGCIVAFSGIYSVSSTLLNVHPLQRSFDIAIIAGYTLYGTEESLVTAIQDIQLIISVVLYAVFFSTVVNRLSRVR